ncbi:hypothetical protein V6N12_056478 [Hibiscus sabdariffa]|uniref:Uncharacterized protein n=1 Tax=Hibiscus sabdariffa TaxID=183260 RepID=A0ABR2CSM6_9ROSI
MLVGAIEEVSVQWRQCWTDSFKRQRIFVAFAKFNGRSEYWRKVRSVGSPGTEQIETNFKNSDGNDFNANLKDNIRLKEKVHVEDVVSRCQKGKVEPSSVVSHRAVDNSRCLGLLSDVSEGLISKESTKKTSSWAASVDALNNALNNNYDNLDSDKSKRFWGLSCGG